MVVGIPGHVVKRSGQVVATATDLHHDLLPDTIGKTVETILERMQKMEKKVDLFAHSHPMLDGETNGNGKPQTEIHAPIDGVWMGEDFSI